MHRRTCSKDHGNAGTNSEKAGEKGRDLERPDVSVLTGAVPKEAASISACDPKFFAKDNCTWRNCLLQKTSDRRRKSKRLLSVAVPKKAASISPCDPKVFAKDNSSKCNIRPSDLHPSQGVILHGEELSFAKNFRKKPLRFPPAIRSFLQKTIPPRAISRLATGANR